MNKSTMFKLMHKINKYYNLFNKYIPYNYLASISVIISIWDRIKSTKLTKFLKGVFKILFFINIIFGIGVIVYYTDIITPINTTYSIYIDLIEPYIQIIIHLYNEVINYYNTIISQFKLFIRDLFQGEVISNQVSKSVEESIHKLDIKDEVKEGIKSGLKEIIQDLKDDLDELDNKSDFFKQIIIFGTLLFGIYFIIILPNNTEAIQDYNWFNTGLINIKLSIIDLFSKPNNPGTPSAPSTPSAPGTPIPAIRILVDVGVSPIVSPIISEGSNLATITPNTPILPIQTLSEFVGASTQTTVTGVDVSTQTYLDGIGVSKMVETTNILSGVLDKDSADIIKSGVNNIVQNITD